MSALWSRREFLRSGGVGVGGALVALGGVPPFTARAAPRRRTDRLRLHPRSATTTLWYTAPGSASDIMEQGLPIGNGRIGAMWTGDPAADALAITDASMWLGTDDMALQSDGQFAYDTGVQQGALFGSLQPLSVLHLSIPGHASVSRYRRELDLANGLATATYRVGHTDHTRTVFASHPDDVIVVRLTAHGRDTLSGAVTIAGMHGEQTTGEPLDDSVSLSGRFDNGLRYAAVMSARGRGGRVSLDGGRVTFADCHELTIAVTGGTNYVPDPAQGYMDGSVDPLGIARAKVDHALRLGAEALSATHVADHGELFGAMSVDLGRSTAAQRALPTPARLAARAADGAPPDPELEGTYLQFGRYLTVAGSRSGLPTGLQGIWLDRDDTSWGGDYHTDINLEMNYWLPDRAGLSASFEPLVEYCLSQQPLWERSTKTLFLDPRNGFRNTSGKVAGWTIAISENIYGGDGWWWHPCGSAWLCASLYEHYQFTRDSAYLSRIMPLLKGACEFWEARLIETRVTADDGVTRTVLIDDHDWSPEQGPTDARGITYAQELVWRLFENYRHASRTLGRDAAYAARLSALQSRLYLPQVSPLTGWLEEWMTPENLGDPQHRHLSPLIGFCPTDRITLDESPPDLLGGVLRLLIARGMQSFGWAEAWRAMCWARFHDADRSYELVTEVMRPSVNASNGAAENLFDMYSLGDSTVFQIDANFGTPTAMLEMLLYSRPGVIELLPALPDAWPSGRATGIGARGGFSVELVWRDGQVTAAVLRSDRGGSTEVRYGNWSQSVELPAGGSIVLRPPPRPRTYTITNRASGLVVGVQGDSASAGAAVVQTTDTGSMSQRWKVMDVGGGRFELRNVGSGLSAVVDGGGSDPGATIILWPEAGATNEQWTAITHGAEVTLSNVRSRLVLGVADGSGGAGAVLEQEADSGAPTQRWLMTPHY